MNADILLKHFNRIIEADGALPRMRRFILDLAVRGKLVDQDPSDDSAEELFKLIQAENRRLIESGLRKKRPFSAPNANEQPYAAPMGWLFVRLGDVLEMSNGRAFKPSDWLESGLPIIRIQNLNNADAPFNFCDPDTVDTRHFVQNNDFLISWSGTPGTSFGAFIWNRGDAALNQHIFRCRQIVDAYTPKFMRLAINSQLDVLISQAQGGVGLQHVTKGTLESLPLPLPPLSEQHQIVVKVEELTALCDKFEAIQYKREKRRDRLVISNLNRICASNSTESKSAIHLHVDNFSHLTTKIEHIKLLRQTILDLAVRGSLTQRCSSDDSVEVLLEKISKEQENLIEKGILKRRILATEQEGQESLFSIPEDWQWVGLKKLITFGPQNGVSPKETRDSTSPKAITLTATTSGLFNGAYFKHVELCEDDCDSYWLSSGDVLFQRGNTREYVGIAAIFEGQDKTFVYPDLMIRVRFSDSLHLRYIHLALVSPSLRRYFSDNATGASSTMPKINQTVLLNTPIPIPSFAEQSRIVYKVNELMALCDGLETQLTSTKNTNQRLLESVLNKALDL